MARRGRPPYPDVLTPREWEVLALLREGLSNEEIAERLGFTLAGAKYHVSEILGKLGVESREEAARWSAAGERPRPWWAAIAAPIGLAWRKLTSGPLPALTATSLAILIAAGIALLAWALLRTSGGGSSALSPTGTAPAVTQPAVVGAPTPTAPPVGTTGTACPGGPTVPASSAPLFAYAATDNTIWVVGADGSNSTQLICSATGGQNAAWSASGRYLAHVSDGGALHILDATTGEDSVADEGTNGNVLGSRDMQWSHTEDVLVYERSADIDGHPRENGIWSVTQGATPSKIVDTPNGSTFWLSPNGRSIAYVIPSEAPPTPSKESRTDSGGLFLVNADGTGNRKVADGSFILSSHNAWSPDGRLVAFWRNISGGSALSGDAFAFDTVTGREIPLGRAGSDQQAGWAPGGDHDIFNNIAVDVSSGSATPLFDAGSSLLDWSPDGRKVAYLQSAPTSRTPGVAGPAYSLVVLDVATDRLTAYESSTAPLWVHQPGYRGAWSPDGAFYAFVANEASASAPEGTGEGVLFVADVGAGTAKRALGSLGYASDSVSYSPDGTRLLLQQRSGGTNTIWTANADGSNISKVAEGAALSPPGTTSGWRPTS
jgi:Tol biopolymer transport system component/DNA-binding CsgD family transcriptional regulator